MKSGPLADSNVSDQPSPTSDWSQTRGRRDGSRPLSVLAAAIVMLLVLGGPATLVAQDSYGQPAYPNSRQPLSTGQLEQLVAPIALYPDALVAQILAASTYPQQVAEADQWRQSQNDASPEAIADGAAAQPWDPSVMALTAFPSVLAQMDRNLQWTSDLGNAYYNQPQDVMEAVQVMRRRAQEAGTLQSTPQQVVRYEPGYIELAPVNPEVVYVPSYNPWTVYGEPVSPYPGFSLLGAVGDFFGSTLLHYGAGFAMAAFSHTPFGWLAWGLNWLTQAVLFNQSDWYSNSSTVADWGLDRHRYHAYAGRGFGGFHEAGFHGGNRWGGENWRHSGRGRGDWREFGRNSARSQGWGEHSSRGFESFRNNRASVGGFNDTWRSNPRNGHTTFASNFHRSPATGFEGNRGREQSRSFEQRGGFQGERFGNRSTANVSGSRFSGSRLSGSQLSGSRSSGSLFSSRGFRSSGETARSSGLHFSNSGRSQRSSAPKGWGGFHSSGGGHAPKSFGGGGHSFGGGRSHGGGGHSGGGHSGGHGGSKHH